MSDIHPEIICISVTRGNGKSFTLLREIEKLQQKGYEIRFVEKKENFYERRKREDRKLCSLLRALRTH